MFLIGIGLILAIILFIIFWWTSTPSQKELDKMAKALSSKYPPSK
jgi:nitrogen fixation-related uncharacterized protein